MDNKTLSIVTSKLFRKQIKNPYMCRARYTSAINTSLNKYNNNNNNNSNNKNDNDNNNNDNNNNDDINNDDNNSSDNNINISITKSIKFYFIFFR